GVGGPSGRVVRARIAWTGRADQLPPPPPASELLTLLKVELTLVPSAETMVMHATMIRASMTAYSTAVGPSSLTRNRRTREAKACMRVSLEGDARHLGSRRASRRDGHLIEVRGSVGPRTCPRPPPAISPDHSGHRNPRFGSAGSSKGVEKKRRRKRPGLG